MRGHQTVILLSILLVLTLSSQVHAQEDFVEFTGLEIALKTMGFIESLRINESRYTWAAPCKYDDCKPSGIPLMQNPAWMAYAYSGLYEATGDEKYLDKVREHMTDLRRICPPDNIRCVFVGVQAEKAYQLTGDESYLDYLKLISRQYIQALSFMLRGIGSRELALKSKYFGLKNPLDVPHELKQIEWEIERNFDAARGTGLKRSACWSSLAWFEYLNLPVEKMVPMNWIDDPSLDRARVSDHYHLKYRQFPYNFHEETNFSEMFNGENPDVYSMSLMDILPCLESLQIMYRRTGEDRYLEEINVLEDYIIQHHWDTPDNRKYNGDYGFMGQGCVETIRGESCYLNVKLLNDNAYIVYLFANSPNKRYLVEKTDNATYYPYPVDDPDYPEKITEIIEPSEPEGIGDFEILVDILLIFIILFVVHALRKKIKKPGIKDAGNDNKQG